jgi:50S ribosomal subunit-associated GTPase HflX
MLEVWNKIDLTPEAEVEDGAPKISSITGSGMKELIDVIEGKLNALTGRQKYEVEYGLHIHNEVLQWIKDNTSHSFNIETEYNYVASSKYPSGSVKIFLDLNEASINKLNKFLNPNQNRSKNQKGMPPKEGW